VAEKCVEPSTQHPYSMAIIEKAMAEIGFSVKQNKTAKSQVRTLARHLYPQLSDFPKKKKVSECIKKLQTESKLPIQRARMRIRVFMPPDDYDQLREKVLESADMVELDQMKEHEREIVCVY
jgi:ribosome maturation protein SDO1